MAALPPTAAPKPGEPKSASVARLLSVLATDLTTPTLTPAQLTATLEQLKVHGRDPSGCDAIFADDGITTLCTYAFDGRGDPATSREALRCLANALLLSEPCRATFVRLGHAHSAASRFETADTDDEFLLSRVLFLATFAPPLPAGLLDGPLPSAVAAALSRHAAAGAAHPQALTETLKLLFNLGHHTHSAALLPCLPPLMTLLTCAALPTPPLQGLIPHLINAPLSLPLPAASPHLFPPAPAPPPTPVDKLLDILSAATQHLPDGDDAAAVPLITLLRKLLELHPPPDVLATLRSRLLPAAHERDAPLGTGDSLPARLLRLTAAAAAPDLREHVAALLFELSGCDPDAFVANVGYGYASGFLASRGLGAGGGAGVGAGVGVGGGGSEREVNPVTGQWADAEPAVADPFAGMTAEEKEREAERMFVLFERLRRTGVVQVSDPVRDAVEEGRFEELGE